MMRREVELQASASGGETPGHNARRLWMFVRGLIANRSFWRYVTVGVLSNGCGYCIYLLITALGLGPKASMTLLYVAGTLVSFFGNRSWSFGDEGRIWPSLLRYGLAYLFGYGLNWLLLHIFVDELGYPHQLVQAAAIVVVALYLFPAVRFFVFRKSRMVASSSFAVSP